MKIVRVCTNMAGDGREIIEELAKHPGWKIEAVFPLGHIHHNEAFSDDRHFFVLLKPEEIPNGGVK